MKNIEMKEKLRHSEVISMTFQGSMKYLHELSLSCLNSMIPKKTIKSSVAEVKAVA